MVGTVPRAVIVIDPVDCPLSITSAAAKASYCACVIVVVGKITCVDVAVTPANPVIVYVELDQFALVKVVVFMIGSLLGPPINVNTGI